MFLMSYDIVIIKKYLMLFKTNVKIILAKRGNDKLSLLASIIRRSHINYAPLRINLKQFSPIVLVFVPLFKNPLTSACP